MRSAGVMTSSHATSGDPERYPDDTPCRRRNLFRTSDRCRRLRPKCTQTGIIQGRDFCADMTNNAQTAAATSAELGRRRDCILVAKADLRRSKDRFRPQPVWNCQFGASRGLSARPEDCACEARLSRHSGRKCAFWPAGPEQVVRGPADGRHWRRSQLGQALIHSVSGATISPPTTLRIPKA